MIDVTTTAVLRPALLEQTFSSFRRLLFKGYPLRLILNVDRVGSDVATVDDVLAVARRHFEDVVLLTQGVPNQNTALKAVWSRVESNLFFNLEDDWELLVDLSFEDMISVMREFPRLASLRLPQNRAVANKCKVYKVCPISWYFTWNGRYFEAPPGHAGFFGGVPSLIRTAWMRPILPLIVDGVAVESMCRMLSKTRNPLSAAWEWGCYTKPGTFRTVAERGKAWRRDAGYRQDDKYHPHGWIRNDAAAH